MVRNPEDQPEEDLVEMSALFQPRMTMTIFRCRHDRAGHHRDGWGGTSLRGKKKRLLASAGHFRQFHLCKMVTAGSR